MITITKYQKIWVLYIYFLLYFYFKLVSIYSFCHMCFAFGQCFGTASLQNKISNANTSVHLLQAINLHIHFFQRSSYMVLDRFFQLPVFLTQTLIGISLAILTVTQSRDIVTQPFWHFFYLLWHKHIMILHDLK